MSEPNTTSSEPLRGETLIQTRYWMRATDPAWGFVWKGLLPLLVLGGLVLYGATAFASRTEERVRTGVQHALLARDMRWVTADSDGQLVTLTGVAPNPQAERLAESIARGAQCGTWLGPLPCATQVKVAFKSSNAAPTQPVAGGEPSATPEQATPALSTPELAPPEQATAAQTTAEQSTMVSEPSEAASDTAQAVATANVAAEEARWYALRVERTAQSLRLTGDVPSDVLSRSLTSAAQAATPAGTAIKNALTISEGTASETWQAAANRAIQLAAQCTSGKVDISSGKLEVNCEVPDAATRDALKSLSQQPLVGLETGTLNFLVLEEVTACEEALGKLLRRSQIRFATSSASLLPSSRPLLREIASQLEGCPGVVVVEGHTDGQGVREENIALSKRRAEAVVRVLKGYNVPDARVRAEGFGPDRPLATNDTATGRAQNRRIEFRVARNATSGE